MYAVAVPSQRTQIYLERELRERIDRVRAHDGRSMAEVVRAALDRYLADEERVRLPLGQMPRGWIGAWSEGESQLPAIRAELEDRARRLGY